MRLVATEFQGKLSVSGEKINDKVIPQYSFPLSFVSLACLQGRRGRAQGPGTGGLQKPWNDHVEEISRDLPVRQELWCCRATWKAQGGPLPPPAERQSTCRADRGKEEGATQWDHKLEEHIRGAAWCCFEKDTSECGWFSEGSTLSDSAEGNDWNQLTHSAVSTWSDSHGVLKTGGSAV